MIRGIFIAIILMVMTFVLTTRCGSKSGLDGGSGSSANVNLVIQNPDPNSSGTAKAIFDADLSSSKAVVTKASLNSGILTITGSDMKAIAHNFSVDANAATITTSLTVPAGKDRTFSLNLDDTNETTNGITVGYTLSGTKVDIADGSNSITLKPSFKNLATDEKEGVHFIRFNQENKTQTKYSIGFGSALTDTQKRDLRCIIEYDGEGTRKNLCVIDAGQGNGLVTGAKCGAYILITGGTDKASAFVQSRSGVKLTRLNSGTWGTTSSGNTLLTMTESIAQTKENDSDQAGLFALACSLTGSNPYDLIPNSGFAKFDLSANTGATIDTLATVGASCSTSRDGETCGSGFCGLSGVCVSTSVNFSSSGVVTNLAGPVPGTTTAGSTNGQGDVARFSAPFGLCISPDGTTLFVTEVGNDDIRQIAIATANVTTLAGTAGSAGFVNATGSAARFNNPSSCVVDSDGVNLYVTEGESGSGNHAVRKIVIATGVVTTVAGTGSSGSANGTGTAASFNSPEGIAICKDDSCLYVSDTNNHTIRKIIISSGVVTTLAGQAGVSGRTDGTGTAATFAGPRGIVVDSTGTIYVSNNNPLIGIRKVIPTSGIVTTLTTEAGATGMVIDPQEENLYMGTGNRHFVGTAVIATGAVSSAFAGLADTSGDANGTGTAATFNGINHLAMDPGGSIIFVADTSNNKIRQIR